VNKVLALTLIHERSERLPGKMFARLGGKPLCHWSIDTLREATARTGVDYRLGVWPKERRLMALAEDKGVPIIPRTERSAYGETTADMYDPPLVQAIRSHWDAVLLVNVAFPFLTIADHVEWIERARVCTKTHAAAWRKQRFIWDAGGHVVLGTAQPSTHDGQEYFEPHGAYYAAPTADIGTARLYEGVVPVPVPDEPRFRLDIDTVTDLTFANLYLQYELALRSA